MKRLRGVIEAITFHNPENSFTIAQMHPEGAKGPVTLVGSMTLRAGESLEAEGEWVEHPKFGRQFKVERYVPAYPATVEGIERYLGSGLITGIGPVMAERIVERFGAESLEVIDQQPRRLLQVAGLGRKRVKMIAEAWKQQRQLRDVMVFLQSHGVGTAHAVRIYQRYGDEAINTVRQDPYSLERDIRGIGFQTADQIAEHLGVARDAPSRVRAGIRYILEEAADDGHVYVGLVDLQSAVTALLQVDESLLAPAVEQLRKDGDIVTEPVSGSSDRHFRANLHRAETGVAADLLRILQEPGHSLGKADPAMDGEEGNEDVKGLAADLGEDQLRALRLVYKAKAMVLTGGPGTGKTTVTRHIVDLLERAGLRVLLCSPTGRAAKRLAEATGRDARTIHRLLEFAPAEGGFRRDRDNPLEAQAVIVDESSMIDVSLMHALMRAVPDDARLILVGDVDQLPSVGPGAVMGDIIASGVVPVARLSKIYRQAGESLIIANAHRINGGEWPQMENGREDDFFFIEEDEPEAAAQRVEDLVARRLPEGKGFDPHLGQIQVLTPMYRGETGAISLNQRLQARLTPGRAAHAVGDRELREGDRVLQVRNNYDKGVFNGDLGRLSRLEKEDGFAEVVFDAGGLQRYEFAELDELTLAYAISIHRAQGSEFPAVVLPLTTQHYPMLQRNLLYTAVTRARNLLIIVGSRRALGRALSNDRQARRHTALAQRLQTTE
ncbi:MAG: ATP-dependent RecD-like DNA helicase [Candidatus Latescibacterota bacterium]|nr:ATP-dependent RecD-like DNA helicase [Candidatus Latescibacterota bacterium]